MSEIFEDSTCCGCSLLCDDVVLDMEAGQLVEARNACDKGREWIIEAVEGVKKTEQAEVIDQAKRWIAEAELPLVSGLSGLTLKSQAAAIQFSHQIEATLSLGTDPNQLVIPSRYGGASCSLGEIRHRADLIIALQTDPFEAWPRFEERMLNPAGRFVEQQREVIYLGEEAKLFHAEKFSQTHWISCDETAQALWAIREAWKNRDADDAERSSWNELIRKISAASYPVLLRGPLASNAESQRAKLVQEMSQQIHFHTLKVSEGPAGGSPQETILAMTGFPDAVRFRGTEIEHDPVLFHADRLLEKKRVDLMIWFGAEFSQADLARFQKMDSESKLIVLHSGRQKLPSCEAETLEIKVPVEGVTHAGSMLRCDGVPVPVRKIVESEQPGLIDILQQMTFSEIGQAPA